MNNEEKIQKSEKTRNRFPFLYSSFLSNVLCILPARLPCFSDYHFIAHISEFIPDFLHRFSE